MMKHKLLTLCTPTRKKNRGISPLSIAILAVCLGTLSGCASQKASGQNTPVQAETASASESEPEPGTVYTAHPLAPQPDLPFASPMLPKNSATVILYMKSDSGSTLAYIDSLKGRKLTFDDAEWVDAPSDRAKELHVEEEAKDAGFYIYNEEASLDTLPLAKKCKYRILDWQNSYEPKNISLKEFSAVLKEREGLNIPYVLTIKKQKIVKIEEHYVP